MKVEEGDWVIVTGESGYRMIRGKKINAVKRDVRYFLS